MNDPNPLETNPLKPGYVNPTTKYVNPGYAAYTAPIPSSDPAFVASKAYALNDAVTFGGNRYVSLAGANVTHTPDISPSFWRLANTDPFTLPATAPVTLSDVAIRTVHLETLTRSLFERLTAVEAKLAAVHGATK